MCKNNDYNYDKFVFWSVIGVLSILWCLASMWLGAYISYIVPINSWMAFPTAVTFIFVFIVGVIFCWLSFSFAIHYFDRIGK